MKRLLNFYFSVELQVLGQTLLQLFVVLIELVLELGIVLLEMLLEIAHDEFEVVKVADLHEAVAVIYSRRKNLLYLLGGFAERGISYRLEAFEINFFGEFQ